MEWLKMPKSCLYFLTSSEEQREELFLLKEQKAVVFSKGWK